jgi:hypothetical protein
MSEPKTEKKPLLIDMSEIFPIVDAILAQDETPNWSNVNHVSLVARTARLAIDRAIDLELNDDEQRLFVCRTLDQHGIAGNASQFRQYLASEKGGKRIPEGSAKANQYK